MTDLDPESDNYTNEQKYQLFALPSISLTVWGYAIGAVTMISVASITCIMMVPCIQRFPLAYGRLLSFLVAMAVGTLSGDSVLHLLPHVSQTIPIIKLSPERPVGKQIVVLVTKVRVHYVSTIDGLCRRILIAFQHYYHEQVYW